MYVASCTREKFIILTKILTECKKIQHCKCAAKNEVVLGGCSEIYLIY